MSRILRRPMFRGGKVIDSRGTGITSGLMDGGRVGYQQAGFVVQPPGAKGKSIFDIQDILAMGGAPMTGQQILDFAEANQMNLGRDFKINPKSKFIPDEVIEGEGTENEVKIPYSEKIRKDGIPTYKDPNEKYLGSGDKQGGQDEITDLTTEQVTSTLTSNNNNNNDTTGNNTSSTTISPEDAIRENAELFKELLGEASKEDIKKARIQDASDYLLKFFAGTQKEGADVGSAAAEVAEFAVSRDSRTDRAKEAAKKTDQTATALAINDYIAGKRSKEEINKLLAGYAAKAEFAKGDTASQIADFAGKQGYLPGVDIIKTYIRDDKALSGKEIVEFDSSEQKVEYSPGDENRIYIDTKTKQVFTFNKDEIRIPISG